MSEGRVALVVGCSSWLAAPPMRCGGPRAFPKGCAQGFSDLNPVWQYGGAVFLFLGFPMRSGGLSARSWSGWLVSRWLCGKARQRCMPSSPAPGQALLAAALFGCLVLFFPWGGLVGGVDAVPSVRLGGRCSAPCVAWGGPVRVGARPPAVPSGLCLFVVCAGSLALSASCPAARPATQLALAPWPAVCGAFPAATPHPSGWGGATEPQAPPTYALCLTRPRRRPPGYWFCLVPWGCWGVGLPTGRALGATDREGGAVGGYGVLVRSHKHVCVGWFFNAFAQKTERLCWARCVVHLHNTGLFSSPDTLLAPSRSMGAASSPLRCFWPWLPPLPPGWAGVLLVGGCGPGPCCLLWGHTGTSRLWPKVFHFSPRAQCALSVIVGSDDNELVSFRDER
jgi:hypothetical protein